jgi:hypothetical protein
MENPIKVRSEARFNVASVVIAAIALLMGLLVANGKFSGGSCGEWGFDCFFGGILIGAAICLLGLVAALVAFGRAEKKLWLSWLGLVLNGLPVLLVAGFAFAMMLK